MFKISYIIIPLVTLAVAFGGGQLTSAGMKWYQTIHKPAWTPPGAIIGLVWTVIFILATVSAILVWNLKISPQIMPWIAGLFLANAALNVAWSYLFFYKHLMLLAGWEAALLDLSVIILIIVLWPLSRLAAGLLIPYAGWVAFATYLTFTVANLNR